LPAVPGPGRRRGRRVRRLPGSPPGCVVLRWSISGVRCCRTPRRARGCLCGRAFPRCSPVRRNLPLSYRRKLTALSRSGCHPGCTSFAATTCQERPCLLPCQLRSPCGRGSSSRSPSCSIRVCGGRLKDDPPAMPVNCPCACPAQRSITWPVSPQPPP